MKIKNFNTKNCSVSYEKEAKCAKILYKQLDDFRYLFYKQLSFCLMRLCTLGSGVHTLQNVIILLIYF